jgi:Domain of unknown function (DUF4411)
VTYVLDTSMLSALHRNYYRDRFPSLWKRFDQMTDDGAFTSAREAYRELEDFGGAVWDWAQEHEELFPAPDAREGAFVAGIYRVAHFQANVERQKLLKGGRNADPFLVARASAIQGTVVTMEKLKPNAARIPNICKHFSIPCFSLEEFMAQERWTF